LGNEVDLILDGGGCEIGIESTIVDLSRGRPVLLRPGRIGAREIAATLGVAPVRAIQMPHARPGRSQRTTHRGNRFSLSNRTSGNRNVRGISHGRGVLSFRSPPEGDLSTMWIEASRQPNQYGHDLYAHLRALDSSGCDRILVEEPPATDEWAAIRDRLSRARSG